MSANKVSNLIDNVRTKKVAFVFFGPPTPPDLRRIRKMPTPPVPMYDYSCIFETDEAYLTSDRCFYSLFL